MPLELPFPPLDFILTQSSRHAKPAVHVPQVQMLSHCHTLWTPEEQRKENCPDTLFLLLFVAKFSGKLVPC